MSFKLSLQSKYYKVRIISCILYLLTSRLLLLNEIFESDNYQLGGSMCTGSPVRTISIILLEPPAFGISMVPPPPVSTTPAGYFYIVRCFSSHDSNLIPLL